LVEALPQGIKKRNNLNLLLVTSNTPDQEVCHSTRYALMLTQVKGRKRKRSQESEAPLPSTATPYRNYARSSSPRSPVENTIGENIPFGTDGNEINLLEYWNKELRWHKEYFKREGSMNHLLPL
jgi:hypothetical protein